MSFSDIVNSYRIRLSTDGLTIKDEYINSIKDSFTDSFDNNVNYKEIQYKKRNETNYTTIEVHIFQVKKDTEKIALDNVKRIVFKDLNFVSESGDLFEFDNEKWLITSTNNIDIIKSCVVQQTNNTLKFYQNEILYQIPCIIQSNISISQLNIENNKYISIPADKYIITCSNNSDSSNINENTRFILTGIAYSIIGIDNISSPGLLNIRIKKDQISSEDDLVNGIAYNSYINGGGLW